MAHTIGSKIVLEGEKEYRQALQNINAEQKNLRSELKLCTSEFDGQQNSLEALTKKHEILERQIESQNKKVELYTQRLEETRKAHEKAGENVENLSAKLDAAQKEMEEMKKSSDTSSEALEAQQKKINELSQALEGAKDDVARTGTAVITMQSQVNNANAAVNTLNSELKTTEQHMEEARNSVDNCAVSIDGYGKKVKVVTQEVNELGEETKETGNKFDQAVDAMASALAAAGVAEKVGEIAEELKECVDEAARYETALAKVYTIADQTVVPMENMSEEIMEVSDRLGKGADEISEAAYNAISAGVDTANAVSFTEKATKLSVGGFTEAETAVDILTTTLNAYNLEAEETERISDMLITTQNLGKTTVADLATNMGKVIPVAAAYNVEMDNLSTGYAVLTANGIATAESTTTLKAMLSELGDTGSIVGKILTERTGKTFAQLSKQGLSLGDVIQILGDHVEGDTTKFNMLWSSTEAGVGALSLLGSGTEKYNSVLKQMRESTGATDAAYNAMADTVEMAEKRMENSAKNLKIAIGESLKPEMEELYEAGDDILGIAADFVRENPEVVHAVTALTAGIGTFTVGVTAATAALKGFEILNKLINPTTFLVSAMAGLAVSAGAYLAVQQSVDNESEEMIKTSRELLETLNKEAQTRREAASASETEIATTRRLTQELEELDKKETLSASEKKRMLMIVSELNQALPDLNLAIDEQTGHLSENAKGWEKSAEAMMESLELQYKQEDLNAIAKEQYEAQKQLTEIISEREELERRLADASAEYNEASQGIVYGTESQAEAMYNASQKTQELTAAIEEQKAVEEEFRTQVADLELEFNNLHEELSAVDEKLEESSEYQIEYGGQLCTVKGLTAETREEVAGLAAEYEEAKLKAEESISAQVGLFDELKIKSELSVEQMSSNLQTQTDAFNQYKDDLLAASELVEQGILDEGLLGAIQELGIDGAGYLHELATASEDDIGAVVKSFEEMQEAKDNLSGAIADMQVQYSDRMDELLGIQTDKQELYKSNVDKCNTEVNQKTAAAGQEMVATAAGTMTDFNTEIVTGTTVIIQSTEELCSKMVTTANTKLNIVEGKSLVFQEIGRSIPNGLTEGIRSGTSEVEAAITDLVDRMIDKAVRKIEDAAKEIDRALGNALR